MDKNSLSNIFEQEVNSVFAVVTNATTAKRPKAPLTSIEQKLDRLSAEVSRYALSGFFIMLILTGVAYYFRSSPLANTIVWIGILLILLGYLINILVILQNVVVALGFIKNRHSSFLSQVRTAYSFDLQYVNQLSQFDKRAIQYVLTYYKHMRDNFKCRAGLVVGSLERVGIFPALGALMVLALTLSKSTFLAEFALMIPTSILALYCLSLFAYAGLERKERVIALLEFCIQSRS